MFSFCKKKCEYVVRGPHGGLSIAMELPEGFDKNTQSCPLVILMHGFMSNKELYPLKNIAKALAAEGIASVRFDFDGHGKSEGRFEDMTVPVELEDAKAVVEYASKLPFVTGIALVGHSQGGVVAGMVAGQLEKSPSRPVCVVQMAPAAVLVDDAIEGHIMNKKYDAANPPEHVNVMFHKLGRNYILEARKLPIYEVSAGYTGKVLLIHGVKDKIVPLSYSRKYHQTYRNSELVVLEKEGHILNGDKRGIVAKVVAFLKDNLAVAGK